MDIFETIKVRKSVRTFKEEVIDKETIKKVATYIDTLEMPFGAKARIDIVHTETNNESIKLGTYGFIKGAKTFITLVVKGSDMNKVGAAYLFEQVVLYCTTLGLSTCWLGGSFSRKDFRKQLNLNEGEKLCIVSPLGYEHEKRHVSIHSILTGSKPSRRKPFESNFFDKNFDNKLTFDMAGKFAKPLEMVRLAPSANNSQSWRVVKDENCFHFYKSSSNGFDDIDLGIALCHFEQSCKALGIIGKFQIKDHIPYSKKASYVISWIENS
ncbi:MAG: nitroreductase family protein [Bacteroidales bacterium]